MNFNSKINIDISNNLNILNDLSNFVKSRKILLDDRILRTGEVIKATYPEDDDEDLFVLNSLNAIFDVKFDSDDDANLHEYLIDDVPYPTLRLHAGTVIQFNLDLVDNLLIFLKVDNKIQRYYSSDLFMLIAVALS